MDLIAFPIAIIVSLVLLFVGAALLRAAVALANRSIGPVKSDEPIGWDWDADEDDEDPIPADGGPAVPEPSNWLGMRILFLGLLVHLALVVVLQVLLLEVLEVRRGVESVPGALLGLALGFLALSGIVAGLLPTTYKRAALVTLYAYLIVGAIAVFVVGTILVVLG